jgi:hypothetical protein
MRVLVSSRPRFQASIAMCLRSSKAMAMSVKNRGSTVLQKHIDRHHAPLMEHLVDLVETLCAIHRVYRRNENCRDSHFA